jgi:hypothetical protein
LARNEKGNCQIFVGQICRYQAVKIKGLKNSKGEKQLFCVFPLLYSGNAE